MCFPWPTGHLPGLPLLPSLGSGLPKLGQAILAANSDTDSCLMHSSQHLPEGTHPPGGTCSFFSTPSHRRSPGTLPTLDPSLRQLSPPPISACQSQRLPSGPTGLQLLPGQPCYNSPCAGARASQPPVCTQLGPAPPHPGPPILSLPSEQNVEESSLSTCTLAFLAALLHAESQPPSPT